MFRILALCALLIWIVYVTSVGPSNEEGERTTKNGRKNEGERTRKNEGVYSRFKWLSSPNPLPVVSKALSRGFSRVISRIIGTLQEHLDKILTTRIQMKKNAMR